MTSFTLSLPDETYHRLVEIAQMRDISIGDLFDVVATALVTEADAEARFRAYARRGLGKAERGLGLLGRSAMWEDSGIPMRVELTDQAALRRLPWAGLKSYLDAQGWRQVERIGDKALVYVPDVAETEAMEILVPTRDDLGDYVSRMADAVRILADWEQRSALDVYQAILNSGHDEGRLYASGANASRAIGIEDGVVPHQETENLMPAAVDSWRAEGLLEATRIFRQSEPLTDTRVTGFVIALDRPIEQFDGHATLRTQIDEKPRRVRVRFEHDLYPLVIRAFQDKSAVSLVGDLFPGGQRWELRNPRELRLLDDKEDKEDLEDQKG